MGLQRFPHKRFLGLNTRDAPYELDPSESPDEMNTQPIDRDLFVGLKQRSGFRKNPNAITGTPASSVDNMIYWWKLNLWLISFSDGDIYSVSGSGGAATLRFSGVSLNNWRFLVAPDSAGVEHVWAVSYDRFNAENPQKWDGTTATFVTWAGLPPDPANFTSGATTLPGGHVYWRGRMVIWNAATKKNRLFYSDGGNPESPTGGNWGNNFIDFSDDDTTSGITFAMPHQESLIVFREKGIWNVFDNNTFGNRRLSVNRGLIWPYHAVSHPNGRFYFYDSANKDLWSGTLRGDFHLESAKVHSILSGSVLTTSVIRLFVTVDNTILIPVTLPGETVSHFLEFFPGKPGEGHWFLHSNPLIMDRGPLIGPGTVGTSIAQDAGYQPWFWRGGSEAYTWAPDATNDVGGANSGAIDSYYLSAPKAFISEEPIERVRRVHPIYGGKCAIDIYAEKTPDITRSNTPKASYDLTEVSTAARGFPVLRPEARGRFHSFQIRNNVLDKTFELDEIEFAFRGGKEHNQ